MVVWNADFYSYQEIIQSNQSISSNTNQMQLSFCLSAIDCQFSYPFAYTPQIQTRTEFVLGFIDRNAREIDFNVKLDLELKMAAIESSNARPLWLIDENRKLAFFRNNLGQCEHVDTGRLSDKGTLFVELIQDLINLNQYRLNVKSDFRYVGQRVLQGLITEVFSRQYWDAKRNETIVITYYLLNEKIEDRVMRVIPLRATKRRFFKIVVN